MSLNAKKAPKPQGGGNRVEQEPLEIGAVEGRVVGICDLGIQKQRPYKGQEKPPKHMVRLTYEICDEFMVDEDGNEMEDKPRWLSEEMPFSNLDVDLAKSTKRYKAIDPKDTCDGDFPSLISLPCMVVVGQYENKEGKTVNDITDVTSITEKKAKKLPELVNEPQVFLLDDPDIDVFNKYPEWLQDKIKSNLEYEGSLLQQLLEGEGKPKPKPKVDKDEQEDEPTVEDEESADEDDEEEGDWLDEE